MNTEVANTNNAQDPVDIRYEFAATISFMAPQEGIVTVFARDLDHAREIVMAQFGNREKLVVADIYNMEAQAAAAMKMFEAEEKANAANPIPAELLNPKLAN